MSSPYWILKLDAKVREYMDRGLRPKKIFFFITQEHPELEVSSIWAVYRSISRVQRFTFEQKDNNAKLRQGMSTQK